MADTLAHSSPKTAVVTGGAGFIGSHLCEALRANGYSVISLDNYFAGSELNHIDGVTYRRGHTKDIVSHVPEHPDIIFHLGEYARVEQSVLEPDIVEDLNTVGTRGVIDFWRQKKCKLVYAGSSTKFGDDGAARFASPYARTKADNSERIKRVGDAEKLSYAITYFYNVYGPRERAGVYGTVIEQFKRMYVSGAPCAVVRPGTQQRNFTHVSDIVDALMLVGEKGEGDEFGLGNLKAYSIFDIATLFGFGGDVVLFPERTGNRMTTSLDTTNINALGWIARRELTAYIEDFKKSHQRGVKRDNRVLVYSTTMHPVAGLAEESFAELAREVPDVAFDVVTARFTRAQLPVVPARNMTIYRLGFGARIDKFLLPFVGAVMGMRLYAQRRYLFTWSLMASYAALAALFVKFITRSPILITLADQNLDDLSALQRTVLRILVSRADQVYGTHTAQESQVVRVAGSALPRNSVGQGDAFANALRFAYADIVRRRLQHTP